MRVLILSWEYPPLSEQGYADRELFEYWSSRDPIAGYAARLQRDGAIGSGDLDRFKRDAEALVEQQARFDSFRELYNTERPHEALAFRYPAALYRPSPRSYPCALREPEYDQDCAVRRVRSNGEIKWRGELIFVSQVLVGEPVAIEQTPSGDWRLRYADVELVFDGKTATVLGKNINAFAQASNSTRATTPNNNRSGLR